MKPEVNKYCSTEHLLATVAFHCLHFASDSAQVLANSDNVEKRDSINGHKTLRAAPSGGSM